MIEIILSKRAAKDLEKVPSNIKDKLLLWIDTVKLDGVEKTRKLNSYNDKSLHGLREGQRSIRLNRAYRAFYKEIKNNEIIELITIIEVNKHDY
jgi:proteic killer suppression protein